MKQIGKIDPRVIAAEEDLLIDFQFLLQEFISAKKITRAELAELSGLSQARISQVFSAEANPTVKTMARLAHSLGERIEISKKKRLEKVERVHAKARHVVGWGDIAGNDNYSVQILHGNGSRKAA